MLKKILKWHEMLDFNNLDSLALLISVIIFLVSLIFTRNIYVIILCFLYLYELYYHGKKNKYLTFLMNILPIIILSCFLIRYLDLSFFKIDILNIMKIIINTLIFIAYLLVIIAYLKEKEIKYLKKSFKKRSFKNLRVKKIKAFHLENKKLGLEYQKKLGLLKDSDSLKVINANLKNKTINDLEEYVYLNYLRFYKNKKGNFQNTFAKFDFLFLLIHVIILLLAIVGR